MVSDWPPFDIRIRTPRLELRHVTEADVPALIAAAKEGVHDPADMPFFFPWTDRESPVFEWEFYRWYWRTQVEATAESWRLNFVVTQRDSGTPMGIQSIEAKDFAAIRTFTTGSWLGQPHQGQGHGKEMRAAVVHFGFAGLGAETATSASFVDNPTSAAVSRAIGYEENGVEWGAPRGERREITRWRLDREQWEQHKEEGRYPEVELEGLESTLAFLGLDAPTP